MTALIALCIVLLAVCIVLLSLVLKKLSGGKDNSLKEEFRLSRMESVANTQKMSDSLRDTLSKSQKDFSDNFSEKQTQFKQDVVEHLKVSNESTKNMADLIDTRLKQLQDTVDRRLAALEEKNDKKLSEMKQVVDEKLQTTLEERISRSFKEVSERLEQVYKGLGEMQTLAVGVGDLKKVLSGVKTRGILGEIQLGAILEQILAPEQYEKNIVTVKGSGKPVEYAVKLPGASAGEWVYLPIDSKFPADAYSKLYDAQEAANPDAVHEAENELISRVKSFAKDIRTKYIAPPETTDFAVMFLPTENLYAEVVRLGLVEILQKDYRVTVAGPTTMAALLNSLQMGFRTLAIQKRSGEVWKVLGEVKFQFSKFEQTLVSAQKRITQANEEIENLVGTRTRMLMAKLKNVESLPDPSDEGNVLPESAEKFETF